MSLSRRGFLKRALGTGLGTLLAGAGTAKAVDKIIEEGVKDSRKIAIGETAKMSPVDLGPNAGSVPAVIKKGLDPRDAYAEEATTKVSMEIDRILVDHFNDNLKKIAYQKENVIDKHFYEKNKGRKVIYGKNPTNRKHSHAHIMADGRKVIVYPRNLSPREIDKAVAEALGLESYNSFNRHTQFTNWRRTDNHKRKKI
jgi:hypothetical protein